MARRRQGRARIAGQLLSQLLRIAREQGFETLAFPAISCGVYGYPVAAATRIAVDEARAAVAANSGLSVIFSTFGDEVTRAYVEALAQNPFGAV